MDDKTVEFLKKENDRLEEMRIEVRKANDLLKQEAMSLKHEKDSFEQEKTEFQKQCKVIMQEIDDKKAKLKEEEAFFDKKFKILEMGFASLDADKKSFEAQKRAFEFRQKYEQDTLFKEADLDVNQVAAQSYFFRGVSHHLALKKRYKDLIKIYHPDNMDGDKSALQEINREFEQMKKVLSYPRKA